MTGYLSLAAVGAIGILSPDLRSQSEPGFRSMQILTYETANLEEVVQLSLRAWAPVFESLEKAFDEDVYSEFYPDAIGALLSGRRSKPSAAIPIPTFGLRSRRRESSDSSRSGPTAKVASGRST